MDKEYRIIGMMSGTSLDGVDLAFCQFTYTHRWNYTLVAAKTYPYTAEILNNIQTMQLPSTSFLQFKKFQIKYSQYLSQMILMFIQENKLQNIDFVALHGHTIFHQPQQKITVQIANLSTIAAQLKLNVIDVMNGGQGAPLAPYAQDIFGDQVYLNFGGIANVGFRKKGWDINYCNLVFNYYAKKIQNVEFDRGGLIGKKGMVNQQLTNFLANNFHNKDRKSLGRQGFQKLVQSLQGHFTHLSDYDVLHTFYVFLSQQIINSVKSLFACESNSQIPATVICTGGGAKNGFLVQLLQGNEQKIEFILPDERIIDFKEAILFAYLGLKFMENIYNCSSGIGGMLAKGKTSQIR